MYMHHVKSFESGLWTVGTGEGRDWLPVQDYDDYSDAVAAAERLNNPQISRRIDELEKKVYALNALVDGLIDELASTSSQFTMADIVNRYSR